MYTWGLSFVLQSHMYPFAFPKFLQRGKQGPLLGLSLSFIQYISHFIHILALSKFGSPDSNSINREK